MITFIPSPSQSIDQTETLWNWKSIFLHAFFLSPQIDIGRSPAAGVWVHPEGWERSDPHVHPDGPRLPGGLDPICRPGRLDLLQQGSPIQCHEHGRPRLLYKELSSVQRRHLCAVQQAGRLFHTWGCFMVFLWAYLNSKHKLPYP